jgi:hypothetical protein
VVTVIDPTDRDAIVARYAARFAEFGVDARTLNTGKGDKHRIQLDVHAAVGPLAGTTVLDVGCGLAFFYQHLLDHGVRVNYVGYDLVEPFIRTNRERYPDCRFETRDILTDGIVVDPDWVVFCQVFNNRYQKADNEAVVRAALQVAFAAARRGVSIDLLGTHVNYREDHLYYFCPERLFTYAKTLTPFVALRHDYLPFDFTLALYKEPHRP